MPRHAQRWINTPEGDQSTLSGRPLPGLVPAHKPDSKQHTVPKPLDSTTRRCTCTKTDSSGDQRQARNKLFSDQKDCGTRSTNTKAKPKAFCSLPPTNLAEHDKCQNNKILQQALLTHGGLVAGTRNGPTFASWGRTSVPTPVSSMRGESALPPLRSSPCSPPSAAARPGGE